MLVSFAPSLFVGFPDPYKRRGWEGAYTYNMSLYYVEQIVSLVYVLIRSFLQLKDCY